MMSSSRLKSACPFCVCSSVLRRVEGCGLRAEGGGWRVEGGGWRVEGGGWRVEGGGWRVEGGGWMEGGGFGVDHFRRSTILAATWRKVEGLGFRV